MADARHNLSLIRQRILTKGISDPLFREAIVAEATVMKSLKVQKAFWKDIARVKWLIEEDRKISFFHARARKKSSSSHISCVHGVNNLRTDLQAIKNHIVKLYQTLFGYSFTLSGIDEVCEII